MREYKAYGWVGERERSMIDIMKTKSFDVHDVIASHTLMVPSQTRCKAKILSSPVQLRNKLFSCEYLLTKYIAPLPNRYNHVGSYYEKEKSNGSKGSID